MGGGAKTFVYQHQQLSGLKFVTKLSKCVLNNDNESCWDLLQDLSRNLTEPDVTIRTKKKTGCHSQAFCMTNTRSVLQQNHTFWGFCHRRITAVHVETSVTGVTKQHVVLQYQNQSVHTGTILKMNGVCVVTIPN